MYSNAVAQPNRIAVYEFQNVFDINSIKNKAVVRILFYKEGKDWTQDTVVQKQSFFVIGKRKKIRAKPITDKESGYLYNGFLCPDKITPLKYLKFKCQYSNSYNVLIKGGLLLSANRSNKVHNKMIKYQPSSLELDTLGEHLKMYLTRLIEINSNCNNQRMVVKDDTIKLSEMYNEYFKSNNAVVNYDKDNSFIDAHKNKLITLTVSVLPLNLYPFCERCYKTSAESEWRLSVFVKAAGELIWLKDRIYYLSNGDFDNDGNDEFLFFYGTENQFGYILYYDDFKKSIEKFDSYH